MCLFDQTSLKTYICIVANMANLDCLNVNVFAHYKLHHGLRMKHTLEDPSDNSRNESIHLEVD